MFIDKVQAVENKFIDLEQRISDPSVIARQDEWQKLTKEHASLAPIIETFRKYKDVSATIADDKEIIADGSDAELTAMAKEELSELTKEQEALEEELHVLMLPKDPNDDKNVIMEIRGGAGGDEAAIFAGDLFRMYSKYIEKQKGWKASIISSNAPELGGYKEVIFSVEGDGVYGKLKYESGVHRVQYIDGDGSRFARSGRCGNQLEHGRRTRRLFPSFRRRWSACQQNLVGCAHDAYSVGYCR